MTHVLVLITDPATGGLNDSIIAAARAAIASDSGAVESAVWLAEDVACELPFNGDARTARTAVTAALAGKPVDVAVVPRAHRRKRLLVADMESTLVENEFLDDIGARAGLGEKIADITRRAMAGELDFAGALRERVAMLKGQPARILEDAYAGLRIMPGARALIRTMREHGAVTAMVSGGFHIFVDRVQALLGAEITHANHLEVAGDMLTGKVREPIFDRASKLATLKQLAVGRGIDMAETMAVGDGANDLDMVRAAGLGVAFRAKKVLAEAAAVSIKHGDLTALLYLQGYRRSDFVD